MTTFAKFLNVNGLKRKDIAAFLGVSGAFITQISSGDRPLPVEKLALIKANANNWDISMFEESQTPQSESQALVEYLKGKVEDQDALIRELYQKIGALEAQIELARKGEIARTAVGSSDANAV